MTGGCTLSSYATARLVSAVDVQPCHYPLSVFAERCLSLDEKPLLLFKKLKDAGKNPVFMLRHVRDIRAPITVAQGKQAEKKAKGNDISSTPDPNQLIKKADKLTNGTHGRDARAPRPLVNGTQEDDRLCMAAEDSAPEAAGRSTGNGPGHTDALVLWNGTSYAVAIYPYGAGYDDEFDVTVYVHSLLFASD